MPTHEVRVEKEEELKRKQKKRRPYGGSKVIWKYQKVSHNQFFKRIFFAHKQIWRKCKIICFDCFPASIPKRPISAQVFVYVLIETENLTGMFEKQKWYLQCCLNKWDFFKPMRRLMSRRSTGGGGGSSSPRNSPWGIAQLGWQVCVIIIPWLLLGPQE